MGDAGESAKSLAITLSNFRLDNDIDIIEKYKVNVLVCFLSYYSHHGDTMEILFPKTIVSMI